MYVQLYIYINKYYEYALRCIHIVHPSTVEYYVQVYHDRAVCIGMVRYGMVVIMCQCVCVCQCVGVCARACARCDSAAVLRAFTLAFFITRVESFFIRTTRPWHACGRRTGPGRGERTQTRASRVMIGSWEKPHVFRGVMATAKRAPIAVFFLSAVLGAYTRVKPDSVADRPCETPRGPFPGAAAVRPAGFSTGSIRRTGARCRGPRRPGPVHHRIRRLCSAVHDTYVVLRSEWTNRPLQYDARANILGAKWVIKYFFFPTDLCL